MPGEFSGVSTTGLGLQSAKAGIESTFIIQPKDEGGNNIVNDDVIFDVHLVLIKRSFRPLGFDSSSTNDDEVIIGTQEFLGDGKYLAKYTCYVSGDYLLYVKDSEGYDVMGSPFSVEVVPSEMSAQHSLIVGQGTTNGVAGSLAEVRVHARDKYGNFVQDNSEIVEMTLSLRQRHQQIWESNGQELAIGQEDPVGKQISRQLARDDGSGRFTLDYIPLYAGEYDLDLTTFSSGGLWGSYYSSSEMSPHHLISTVHDKQVEILFGGPSFACDVSIECGPFGFPTSTDQFSVSWNGRLSADHDEEYKIAVECNHGGYVR